ncbi:hypothetical protein Sru01_35130 [Sphaerisporangium rufum]|uniref:Putative antitoxin VapB45-like DNA-binding HTH domain-containing protein n=1 Tax=Sphaerisporangium rufum TaxID=1381558 RepID=A0A919R2J2_9ACTN|nr:hypothetical protein Sru01_35130 [Sphaerisporangium rufum]
MDDVRTRTGLLNQRDAARFLEISHQTFNRWARGYEQGRPLLHVLPAHGRRQATVPFVAMAEAYVLDALKRAGVKPHKIRPALQRLRQEFGHEYVLLAPELATDGIDVLWDFSRTRAGAGLIEARTGQHVIREIVTDYLDYVVRAEDGFPALLRLRSCLPSRVVIDPHRAFGQPIFEGGRTRVAEVAAMMKAGEAPEAIADELGVTLDDVRTATRILLGHAA